MAIQEQERSGSWAAWPAEPASDERTDFYGRYGKRLFDLTLSLAVLALTSPLLLLIASAIRLDSAGPAIFAQERVGKDGRRFTIYKFRTMYVASDPAIHRRHVERLIAENTTPDAGTSLKLQGDPRITPVGRILRRSSLDELPQFLNVLRGEMSVVGPRPDVPYAVAAYQPWYHARHRTLPGITGLWQVEARNRVSYEQMIRLDIAYYEQQSFRTDLRLIVQTPLAMLHGAGAG